eukprot:365362-Chlamydomonas_euryale.AAC.24
MEWGEVPRHLPLPPPSPLRKSADACFGQGASARPASSVTAYTLRREIADVSPTPALRAHLGNHVGDGALVADLQQPFLLDKLFNAPVALALQQVGQDLLGNLATDSVVVNQADHLRERVGRNGQLVHAVMHATPGMGRGTCFTRLRL